MYRRGNVTIDGILYQSIIIIGVKSLAWDSSFISSGLITLGFLVLDCCRTYVGGWKWVFCSLFQFKWRFVPRDTEMNCCGTSSTTACNVGVVPCSQKRVCVAQLVSLGLGQVPVGIFKYIAPSGGSPNQKTWCFCVLCAGSTEFR